MPSTQLCSAILLEAAVGKLRSRELIKLVGIKPEINFSGERRCVYVVNGTRCCNYGSIPVCEKHFKEASMLSGHFKSAQLRDEYNRLLGSKYKMHLDGELAMMRLMLGVLVNKLGDNGNVAFEHVAAITAMCEKISGVVDKMSKMNTLTPETIDKMLERVTEIVGKYVPAEHLDAIAAEIAGVQPTVNACDIQFDPGEQVKLTNGEVKEVEVIPLHKRQLVELAAQMKIGAEDA